MISHNQLFIVVAVTTVIFSLFLIFSTDKGWTLNNETTDETIVRSKNNRPQFDKHLNYSLLEKNKSTCFQLAKTNQTRQTSFLLKPQACDDNVDVVIMVKSSIYRNSLRNAIRKTWAKGFDGTIGGRRFKIRTLFVVGTLPTMNYTSFYFPLEQEKAKYADVISVNFSDTIKSVTKKVLVGLSYILTQCKYTKYIVVQDDDSVLVPWNFFPMLINATKQSTAGANAYFYGGFFCPVSKPVRAKEHRWFVDFDEYQCEEYPSYAYGTAFIVSRSTAKIIIEYAYRYEPFSMDDVFFGGLNKELQLPHYEFPMNNYIDCPVIRRSHQTPVFHHLAVCHHADFAWYQIELWRDFCLAQISAQDIDEAMNKLEIRNFYCKNFM